MSKISGAVASAESLRGDPEAGDLIARYDARAPRYTSYPTAVQFSPAVNAQVYGEWLSAITPTRPVSLYVHVPFCARLCWYCGCNTRAVAKASLVSDYVQGLRREIAMVRALMPEGVWANALHLGGGTPNMLSRDDMVDLFGDLRRAFHLAPGADIAAEMDPAVLTRDWVRAAAFHGLNRASLGVQDLSPRVQEAVNRRETFEVLANAVGWLREVGVRSINFDLMYGLPRQTTVDVLSTLDRVLSLRPERLALFGYAHVPWMKPHQKLIAEADLPGAVARLDQSLAAAERLRGEGYVQIGLDHFALPTDELAIALAQGRLHRNFQGYTTDAAPSLVGFGASAISSLPQGFAQNETAELAWRERVQADALPTARGVALTDEDRFRGEIIERLMCDGAADLNAVCARNGRSLDELAPALAQIDGFEADGLASLRDGVITVTPRGGIFVRALCALFDTHLNREAARHARVV